VVFILKEKNIWLPIGLCLQIKRKKREKKRKKKTHLKCEEEEEPFGGH
jgi:hypothetical protein